MKKIFFLLVAAVFVVLKATAQTTVPKDSANMGKVTVYKDSRMDALGKKGS